MSRSMLDPTGRPRTARTVRHSSLLWKRARFVELHDRAHGTIVPSTAGRPAVECNGFLSEPSEREHRCESGAVPQLSPGSGAPPSTTAIAGWKVGADCELGARIPIDETSEPQHETRGNVTSCMHHSWAAHRAPASCYPSSRRMTSWRTDTRGSQVVRGCARRGPSGLSRLDHDARQKRPVPGRPRSSQSVTFASVSVAAWGAQ